MTSYTDYPHSLNTENDTNFPFLILHVKGNQCYPINQGFRILHWHEDIQFVYVKTGVLKVQVLEKAFRVPAGEGLFINKNQLHLILGTEDCEYRSFIFPVYLLSLYQGNLVEVNYMVPYFHNRSFTHCHFYQDGFWMSEILQHLKQLDNFTSEQTETDSLYQYKILVMLHTIWLLLISNLKVEQNFDSQKNQQRNERMQAFLIFIQQHFNEEVALKDIASSGDVSESECLRCFRAYLDMTPYAYLLEFRLSKATELLQSSHYSVSQIAVMSGFNHLSYFSKCFRERVGMSPRAYRVEYHDMNRHHEVISF